MSSGILLFALFAISIPAQTLARPGWAGSGLAGEPWWRNAVFYRIDVEHFQDSDGNGTGDLPGIVQRLDYLQSLGVDAIVISAPTDEAAFNDLVRDAGSRHMRIVIALNAVSAASVLGTARLWLTRGAAGIAIEPTLLEPGYEANAHLRELRALTASFPGERVLLARPSANEHVPQNEPVELVSQLIDFPKSIVAEFFHSTLWQLPAASLPAGSIPLLESGGVIPDMFGDDERGLGLQKIVAARMLASRGAVLLPFGQELGMKETRSATGMAPMQWTPANITPPMPASEPEDAAKPTPPPNPNTYGAFKPYVPPKPVPKPLAPGAPPDPNSLPGFTSGRLHADISPNGATANVAVEDADPDSLLNFYRRLIQLHHDNSSLRSGTLSVLNHDAEKALVWLRRAPTASRTAATVVITCNLSDKPLTLSLERDFAQLHLHNGSLRPLAASWTALPQSQHSNHIVLPPYSVYISELYH